MSTESLGADTRDTLETSEAISSQAPTILEEGNYSNATFEAILRELEINYDPQIIQGILEGKSGFMDTPRPRNSISSKGIEDTQKLRELLYQVMQRKNSRKAGV